MADESAPVLRRSERKRVATEFFSPLPDKKQRLRSNTSENDDPNSSTKAQGNKIPSTLKKNTSADFYKQIEMLENSVPSSSKGKKQSTNKGKGKSYHPKSNPGPKKRKTKFEIINDKLKALGIKPDKYTGNCARAGIYYGFIPLTGEASDLDQVILSGELECGHQCSVTLREVLEQPDYGGNDYEDGLQNATVMCDELRKEDTDDADDDWDNECKNGLGRTYVTGICKGQPSFDCGKFHNHCTTCKLFGKCIGDYREMHCKKCGSHYFGSGGRFKCPCKQRSGGFGSMFGSF